MDLLVGRAMRLQRGSASFFFVDRLGFSLLLLRSRLTDLSCYKEPRRELRVDKTQTKEKVMCLLSPLSSGWAVKGSRVPVISRSLVGQFSRRLTTYGMVHPRRRLGVAFRHGGVVELWAELRKQKYLLCRRLFPFSTGRAGAMAGSRLHDPEQEGTRLRARPAPAAHLTVLRVPVLVQARFELTTGTYLVLWSLPRLSPKKLK